MKLARLNEMKGGWFIGDFTPSLLKTGDFEVSVKFYKKGDVEKRHVHKVATEYTIVAQGCVKMNERIMRQGDIVVLSPGESSDFECLEDNTINVVVKTPSLSNDKFIVE